MQVVLYNSRGSVQGMMPAGEDAEQKSGWIIGNGRMEAGCTR